MLQTATSDVTLFLACFPIFLKKKKKKNFNTVFMRTFIVKEIIGSYILYFGLLHTAALHLAERSAWPEARAMY